MALKKVNVSKAKEAWAPFMLDENEFNALVKGCNKYAKAKAKANEEVDEKKLIEESLPYVDPKYSGHIGYKIQVYKFFDDAAKKNPELDREYYQKDFLSKNPYNPATATQEPAQATAQKPAMTAETAAAQNQADAAEYSSAATSVAATTPVGADGKPISDGVKNQIDARQYETPNGAAQPATNTKKPAQQSDDGWVQPAASTKKPAQQSDDGWVQPVSKSAAQVAGAGSRTSPLPNSVAAQAKATAGQWIMTKNGPYQLKQADIDWAKKKVGAAAQPASTAPAEKPVPASEKYNTNWSLDGSESPDFKKEKDGHQNVRYVNGRYVQYDDEGKPEKYLSKEQVANLAKAVGRRY